MYISEPVSLTEQMLNSSSQGNMYKALLNANFQDYIDATRMSGEIRTKAGKLKVQVSGVCSALGLAVGTMGGPIGIGAGYAVGNAIGKYAGNVLEQKIYGKAMADMADIYHSAKLRHTQLAATLAFNNKMGEAVDTMRQNENKKLKDAINAMAV